jgi:hypothetical protein
MPDCWYTRAAVARYRSEMPINTLSVSGPHLPAEPNPGPDHDHVRVLDAPDYRPHWSPRVAAAISRKIPDCRSNTTRRRTLVVPRTTPTRPCQTFREVRVGGSAKYDLDVIH